METREVAKHPPCTGQSLTTENYLAPHVSSVKDEKPSTREVAVRQTSPGSSRITKGGLWQQGKAELTASRGSQEGAAAMQFQLLPGGNEALGLSGLSFLEKLKM